MRGENEISSIPGRGMQQLTFTPEQVSSVLNSLPEIGITFDGASIMDMTDWANSKAASVGMDTNFTAPLTTPSVTTPVQFLQAWLPGFVKVITAVRRIDELIGIVTQGSWEDEEVVQGSLERTGVTGRLYSDSGNTPLSNWNVNFDRFSIVRFEDGIEVGRLEEARASRIRVNSAEYKREAAGESLEIQRNRVGFFGYNGGNNRTYGFLNSPNLPAYVSVPNGASGSSRWATKTYLEIVADLREALQALRTQTLERVDPMRTPITLAIATSAIDYLTTVSDFGNSVRQWLMENYPNVRVMSAPELDNANGDDEVFYLYAETVMDSGTDDNRTFIQVVPQKFRTLGVDQKAKTYEEAYSNATAGTIVKRPYAIIRRSGI